METSEPNETILRKRAAGRGERALPRPTSHAPASLVESLDRAEKLLWTWRSPHGYWAGGARGDIASHVHFLLLHQLLELPCPQMESLAASIRYHRSTQGAWSDETDGPIDLSLSVACYLALKLAGDTAEQPHMAEACAAIRAAGGADRANGVTRILMARCGQIPYATCPAIPPEILLLPPRAPLSLFRVPLPTRVLLVALSLVWATRRVLAVSPEQGIAELMVRPPSDWKPCAVGRDDRSGRWLPTAWVVRWAERCALWLERHRCHVLRPGALLLAQRWLRDRTIIDGEGISSMAVCFWTALGLDGIGGDSVASDRAGCLRGAQRLVNSAPQYSHDSSNCDGNLHQEWIATGKQEVDVVRRVDVSSAAELHGDEPAAGVVHPWHTAVIDTARALRAMRDLDLSNSRIRRTVDWLLTHEITKALDPPRSHRYDIGGWCLLQPRSRHPDVESTAEVLIALRSLFAMQPAPPSPSEDSMVAMVQANSADLAKLQVAVLDRVAAASRRGRRWLLAMQNHDGGWGRFERYGRHSWLEYSVWSGSFATRDPSSPEVTGAVLEALGRWELRCGRAAIDRAVDFLAKSQKREGYWDGQWTLNPFYATWRAVEGLVAVGIPSTDSTIKLAAKWVLEQQQADGTWGVHPRRLGVVSPEAPVARSSAVQSAWALMTLLLAGYGEQEAVRRGFVTLQQRQSVDGCWEPTRDVRIVALGRASCQSTLNAVLFPYLALQRWMRLPYSRFEPTGTTP
jgi:squalene-hopene/tetraprenyl-beta-curcumene cyclase